MKKIIIGFMVFAAGLYGSILQAQILSVGIGTEFSIGAGTIVSADSLELTPAALYSFSNNTLSKSNTVSNSSAVNYINRVYQFSATAAAYSGALKIYYNNGELNSLSANDLKLLVHNGTLWSLDFNSSVNTASKLVFNSSVNGVSLREITTAAAACTAITWLGGTGNWNNAANWCGGFVPAAFDNIVINNGSPTLNTDFTSAGHLTISGTGGLTINPLNTLTISGTAEFGGKLVTIKSDASGTGSIGKITGTLTGATNVTVERYIPNNGFRSWRLLSVPTYGNGQTINQAWQEGNAALGNNTPGYGTQITGTGSGFDATSTNPSMYQFKGTALEAITNTGAAIATNQGYFLYVRGDRSVGMSSSTGTNTPTTLRTNGTLNQGTQTSATILANNYGLVGNPFASAINFTALTKTGGVGNTFYIWDAKKQSGNSLGVYQTFSATNGYVPAIDGGSYSIVNPNTSIQSGQAFFVSAAATAGTVVIPESSKVASSGTLGYRPAADLVKIDSRLYSVRNNTTTMADANVVVFDAAYANEVNADDAPKFGNTGENLGIQKGSRTLAIEGRQPLTAADTIYFNMWNMQQQSYKLEFAPLNLGNTLLTAMLQDAYTGTNTPVNLGATTSVNFTVNATPASAASNRFRMVFAPAVVLPVSFINISANRTPTGATVNWTIAAERNIRQYEVERSANGRTFITAGTVTANTATGYSFADANAIAGILYYRIKSVGMSGEMMYSSIVKLSASSIKPGYSISPNPVENGMVNLQLKNQPAGQYNLRFVNSIGQTMFSKTLQHTGGSSMQMIILPVSLAAGSYQAVLQGATGKATTQTIIINTKN